MVENPVECANSVLRRPGAFRHGLGETSRRRECARHRSDRPACLFRAGPSRGAASLKYTINRHSTLPSLRGSAVAMERLVREDEGAEGVHVFAGFSSRRLPCGFLARDSGHVFFAKSCGVVLRVGVLEAGLSPGVYRFGRGA